MAKSSVPAPSVWPEVQRLAALWLASHPRRGADRRPDGYTPVAVPAVPTGGRRVSDKRLSELTPADYEIARRSVEDELIGWRDDRLSTLNRNNGLVVKEKDGSPSSIIRFGFEAGMKIAVRALLNQSSPAQPSQPEER